jgi:hypothetical protein
MYLYFQPKGGFNDIFRNLIVSINYCKKHNLIMLFNFKNTIYNINFEEYFYFDNEDEEFAIIDDVKIIYKFEKIVDITFNLNYKVYPEEYQQNIKEILYNKIINYTKIQLPKEDTDISVKSCNFIIFSDGADGGNSFEIFKIINFKNNIKEYIRNNYLKIPKPYISIQIRNTDHTCNYDELIRENRDILEKFDNIFLATDDKNAYLNLKSIFHEKIYCFTNFPTEKYTSLHWSNLSGDTKIKDLLSDLILMCMSEKIISNSKGIYIKLAHSCLAHKEIIFNKI